MQVPIEIVFQNAPPSEELREEILRQAARLERFSDRITSCRVVVHAPETRHRHGDRFRIDVRIAMPQHKDVLVTHAPGDEPEAEHPHVAVAKAFGAAQRQIEDAMRVMRGQTKLHLPADHGVVARFLAEEPCGFIETADGREVYFHRNAVPDGAFDRLRVGDEVRFVEEAGEKGPQASTVHPTGRFHAGYHAE